MMITTLRRRQMSSWNPFPWGTESRLHPSLSPESSPPPKFCRRENIPIVLLPIDNAVESESGDVITSNSCYSDQQSDESDSLSNVGMDDHGLESHKEEENEYYDMILYFKEGRYHIKEVISVGDRNSSSVEVDDHDGSNSLVDGGGGRFYGTREEIVSDDAEANEEDNLDWDKNGGSPSVPAVQDRVGHHAMGSNRRVTQVSFSGIVPSCGQQSTMGTVPDSGFLPRHLSVSSSDSPRSSFAFPVLQTSLYGSPTRMPKARHGHFRHRLPWILPLLCCRF